MLVDVKLRQTNWVSPQHRCVPSVVLLDLRIEILELPLVVAVLALRVVCVTVNHLAEISAVLDPNRSLSRRLGNLGPPLLGKVVGAIVYLRYGLAFLQVRNFEIVLQYGSPLTLNDTVLEVRRKQPAYDTDEVHKVCLDLRSVNSV